MKLRSYLILLVVGAVLPVVIFAGVMTYRSYAEQQQELAQRMIERARAISAALDREFLVSIQSLKVLGASANLDKKNLPEFYLDMKGALAAYSRAWQNLTLTDASGQQVINLRRPFGAPLPLSGNPKAIERVRQTKEAVIADLSPGPVTGAPGIVVHVPVLKDGEVKYVLNAIFYPAPLSELLLQQKLPPNWFATIIDRNQVVVARTRKGEKYFGKPASRTFAAQAKLYREANWRGTTLDDEKVFAALHRSDFTGWTVGLAMPVEEVDASLKTSLAMTASGGLLLLLGALALAAIVGRRIAAPVEALSETAAKLGRGDGAVAAPSSILEIDHVARAMEEAQVKRKEYETRIQQLNRVYAVLSDINQAIVRVRDPQILLAEACRIAVEKGEFRLAWIGRLDPKSRRIEPVAHAGVSDGYVEQLTLVPSIEPHDVGPTAAALRGGQHQVCNDVERDPRMAPWRDEALRRGYRSSAAFPLKIGGEVAGAFTLYSGERGFFDQQELALLDELASDIGLALEMHRNESDRLNAENALRETEERFRQLTENIREVFWLTTGDKRQILYVSPAYETIWGRSCQSLYESARNWSDAIHPEDRERVLEAARRQPDEGAYDQEYRIVRPEGEIRWVRDRAFPVRDAGKVYRVAGISEDITARRQIESEAQKQSQELKLLHEIGQEILSKDAPDIELNETLEPILQKLIELRSFDLGSIRLEDVTQQPSVTLIHSGYRNPDLIDRSLRILELGPGPRTRPPYRVIQTGRAWAVEDVLNTEGLTTLKGEGVCSAILIPLRHGENSVGVLQLGSRSPRKFSLEEIRFYETAGNYLAAMIQRRRLWATLTAAKQGLEIEVAARTRELTEANVKLRELDRVKSQFLANMSHELRTPLNAIIGFSELMHDGKIGGPVSAEQKEYLGDILSSGKHLLQLINDVLDLSKVEAGRMEVLPSTFAIEDIVIEVVQNIAPIMSVKGIKLTRNIPAGLPPITTDRRKFLQILLNLTSNAVKFTDHGEVAISCEIVQGKVNLSVRDTGIGIRAEELENLFQPFSQIDDSVKKRHEGTGLGLYLSKRLARLLGGDITVASEYGKGATFTLTLSLNG